MLHVACGARSLICLDGPVFGPATTDKVLPKRRHGSHEAARQWTENVPDAVYIELKKKKAIKPSSVDVSTGLWLPTLTRS